MKKCSHCGRENEDSATRCYHCGCNFATDILSLPMSPKEEEFRTGRPPTWRVMIYALIAMAIPLYFFRAGFAGLPPVLKVAFCLGIVLTGGMVVFMGIVMPAIRKKHRAWILEHQGLLARLLGIITLLIGLLKLWDVFHKK